MKITKQNQKKMILISVFVLAALAVAAAVLFFSERKKGEDKGEEGLEDYMTIRLFPGFDGEEADKIVSGGLSNSYILLEYAGSYDGIYYEDGQQEERENIFSLILTNINENTLEVMQLWLKDEKGETYQFQVSALPSGGTVLAQELNGKSFRKDASYTVVRDNFGFLASEQELSLLRTDERDGKIYLTNTGNADMGAVQLLYKNWLSGHAYPGGIAYRISLEGIRAGETLEITPEHYKEGKSKLTGMKKTIQQAAQQ